VELPGKDVRCVLWLSFTIIFYIENKYININEYIPYIHIPVSIGNLLSHWEISYMKPVVKAEKIERKAQKPWKKVCES